MPPLPPPQGRHGVRLDERGAALRSLARALLDERQLLPGGAQGEWRRHPLRRAQRKALVYFTVCLFLMPCFCSCVCLCFYLCFFTVIGWCVHGCIFSWSVIKSEDWVLWCDHPQVLLELNVVVFFLVHVIMLLKHYLESKYLTQTNWFRLYLAVWRSVRRGQSQSQGFRQSLRPDP